MKLNNCLKQLSTVGNWITKTLLPLLAIALMWQSPFFVNTTAMAVSTSPVIATTGANNIKGTADEVRDRSKNLIQDTKQKVEKTAERNASKVDEADDEGSFVERKAKRDQSRIKQRAEEDASRTERAVDKSMNAVQDAVENIKDAFGK